MELIPENYQGTVIINVMKKSGGGRNEEIDFGVGLHNWMMTNQLRYLIFDLQDEKDIWPSFIEDVMQLFRRTRIPVLFTGVMASPRAILESFAYLSNGTVFDSVDSAIQYLKKNSPNLLDVVIVGINFGQPIEMVRSRLGSRGGEEEGEGGDSDDDEDVEEAED